MLLRCCFCSVFGVKFGVSVRILHGWIISCVVALCVVVILFVFVFVFDSINPSVSLSCHTRFFSLSLRVIAIVFVFVLVWSIEWYIHTNPPSPYWKNWSKPMCSVLTGISIQSRRIVPDDRIRTGLVFNGASIRIRRIHTQLFNGYTDGKIERRHNDLPTIFIIMPVLSILNRIYLSVSLWCPTGSFPLSLRVVAILFLILFFSIVPSLYRLAFPEYFLSLSMPFWSGFSFSCSSLSHWYGYSLFGS